MTLKDVLPNLASYISDIETSSNFLINKTEKSINIFNRVEPATLKGMTGIGKAIGDLHERDIQKTYFSSNTELNKDSVGFNELNDFIKDVVVTYDKRLKFFYDMAWDILKTEYGDWLSHHNTTAKPFICYLLYTEDGKKRIKGILNDLDGWIKRLRRTAQTEGLVQYINSHSREVISIFNK